MKSPLAALDGRRLLVTGGSGFIGSAIVRLAVQQGARVFVLDTNARADTADAFVVDVRHSGAVTSLFERIAPEIVIHAAGIVSNALDPTRVIEMTDVHVKGAAVVLEASRLVRTGTVVVFGSAGEYGSARTPMCEDGPAEPRDAYAASKRAATEVALSYARSTGLAVAVVRPFNVYGEGEPVHRLLPSVLAVARRGGGTLECTRGEQIRDFVYVDDVAEGALRTALSPSVGGVIINLGTGIGTEVRAAALLASRVSGGKVTFDFGALPYREGEPMASIASVERCRDLLGWVPATRLEEGLARMVATA